MRTPLRRAVCIASWLWLAGPLAPVFHAAARQASPAVPAPESFFGFQPGADGRLAGYEAIREYFSRVDRASDRVEVRQVGTTTDKRPMIAAFISAPGNIQRLDAIRADNQRLADPRTLTDEDAAAIWARHPVVLAIGCSIHATEIGATQTANTFLYELATTSDPRVLAVLDRTVIVLIPSLNPDGHEIVVDWFTRNRQTPFENAPLPWLYHKYAGHDINRDAFMMNLEENRSLARFFYGEWHPQVFLTMHQMGSNGPRVFVPPNYDPIDPNYDPMIWRTAGLLGSAMALELERDGRSGVVSNAIFDYYWPGYEDSAPLGHNTVCLLTEIASAQLANPITVQPGELTGTPRGLPSYAPQINFPNPWPGGTWRLGDIVTYEMSALHGLLQGVARFHDEIVRNFYLMGRRAVDRGAKGDPFAFIFKAEQQDPSAFVTLINLLVDGGVEVHRSLEPFRVADTFYPEGTYFVLASQPYRAYVKTLLEKQVYPVRRLAPGAAPERPYDVAGWTLPLQMGVALDTIPQTFEPPPSQRVERASIAPATLWGDRRPSYYIVDARGNSGTIAINRLHRAGVAVSWTTRAMEVAGYRYAAGSLVVKHSNEARQVIESVTRELGLRAVGTKGQMPGSIEPVVAARVGLFKPWLANIDEGWTRWLFERFEVPFANVSPQELRQGGLARKFDVIVLPDEDPERLMIGHRPDTVPSEYGGGLGSEGVEALRAFVEGGGTLVCLDSSCGLVIERLGLPVAEAPLTIGTDRVFCPGSLLGLDLDPAQPLAFGLQEHPAAFFAFGSAFVPAGGNGATSDAAIVGRYARENLLLSGWLEGEKLLAGQAAVVQTRLGAGRVVLFGFRVQHRAQSLATLRLLFNAIHTHRPTSATAQRARMRGAN